MNNKQKKTTMIGVLIAAILFMSFTKKKPVGTVEVGTGEFGDFGTDGDLDEFIEKDQGKPSMATPSISGKGANFAPTAPTVGFDRSPKLTANLNSSSRGGRCCEIY